MAARSFAGHYAWQAVATEDVPFQEGAVGDPPGRSAARSVTGHYAWQAVAQGDPPRLTHAASTLLLCLVCLGLVGLLVYACPRRTRRAVDALLRHVCGPAPDSLTEPLIVSPLAFWTTATTTTVTAPLETSTTTATSTTSTQTETSTTTSTSVSTRSDTSTSTSVSTRSGTSTTASTTTAVTETTVTARAPEYVQVALAVIEKMMGLEGTTTVAPAGTSPRPPPEFAWSCASYGCVGYSFVAVCQCHPGCRSALAQEACCYDFEEVCADPEQLLASAMSTTSPGQTVQTTLPPELDDSLCGDCVGDTPPNHEDAVTIYSASCGSPKNMCCGACGIWKTMNRNFVGSQVMHGYLVVPSDPVAGVEAITAGTASYYDFLWREAADRANRQKGYALLVNPFMSRTQHQMHIFFRKLNAAGLWMRDQLEELTGCDSTADWTDAQPLGFCVFARARVFDDVPAVFSEVWAEAARGTLGPLFPNPRGAATLGSVGVAVVFGCGGRAVVLGTSGGGRHCSIEHSIT